MSSLAYIVALTLAVDGMHIPVVAREPSKLRTSRGV
jgi:hypothetical protein